MRKIAIAFLLVAGVTLSGSTLAQDKDMTASQAAGQAGEHAAANEHATKKAVHHKRHKAHKAHKAHRTHKVEAKKEAADHKAADHKEATGG